jgi:hypothetical protein
MKYLIFLLTAFVFSSCWTKINPSPYPGQSQIKVWGSKPVYGVDSSVKKLLYINQPQPVLNPGNIYVKDNYIFQSEEGRGIHVIENNNPSLAKRIGFITMNGSSQISIKGNYLYTNSFEDLVVVDMSDVKNIKEVKRVKGAFPEGRNYYFLIQPAERGYYECPRYDSLVIGWRKDSVWQSSCYKN